LCERRPPIAAVPVPAAFFLSVVSPDATGPNGLIYLAYLGAALLIVGEATGALKAFGVTEVVSKDQTNHGCLRGSRCN
jgi:hypothetical protein